MEHRDTPCGLNGECVKAAGINLIESLSEAENIQTSESCYYKYILRQLSYGPVWRNTTLQPLLISTSNLVVVYYSLFKQYPHIKGFLECYTALFKTSSNQWAHHSLSFTIAEESIIVLTEARCEGFIMTGERTTTANSRLAAHV
jgi:hypothetical protein